MILQHNNIGPNSHPQTSSYQKLEKKVHTPEVITYTNMVNKFRCEGLNQLIDTTNKVNPVAIGKFLELDCLFARALQSLETMTEDYCKNFGFDLTKRHSKIVTTALSYLASVSQQLPSNDVQNVVNVDDNGPIQAFLQMLFVAPCLLDCILQLPRLQEVREVYMQRYRDGASKKLYIDLQKFLGKLRTIHDAPYVSNKTLFVNKGNLEDFNDILLTMFSDVPYEVAGEFFISSMVAQIFDSRVSRIEDSKNQQDERFKLLKTAKGHYVEWCFQPSRPPYFLITPKNGVNFGECLKNALKVYVEPRGDKSKYFHTEDNISHFHDWLYAITLYDETPPYLVFVMEPDVSGPRMRVPRVVQLPPESVSEGSDDGRLLLMSFVACKAGRYGTYFRKEKGWCCHDGKGFRWVSPTEVDEALHYVRVGYCERKDAKTMDAELEAEPQNPEIVKTTDLMEILKKLKESVLSKNANPREIRTLFSQLDQRTQNFCFDLLSSSWITRRQSERKILLCLLDEVGETAKDLRSALQQKEASYQEVFAALQQLNAEEKQQFYTRLSASFAQKDGFAQFMGDPRSILEKVPFGGEKSPIIDHLIKNLLEGSNAKGPI